MAKSHCARSTRRTAHTSVAANENAVAASVRIGIKARMYRYTVVANGDRWRVERKPADAANSKLI